MSDTDLTGFYLHERDAHGLGTRVLKLTLDGEEQTWVAPEDFMKVQKERDDLRREVALINAMAHRDIGGGAFRRYVLDALERLCFTEQDAEAMNQILREFGPRD